MPKAQYKELLATCKSNFQKGFSSALDQCTYPSFLSFLKFIYLFMAVLDLHCCTRAFFSCSERGLLFAVVRGLLIAVASLVVEHGL